MKKLYLLFFSVLICVSINAQLLEDNLIHYDLNSENFEQSDMSNSKKNLYLRWGSGDLEIKTNADVSRSPYAVYFCLPIAIREQAPLWLDVECPGLVDYRFVRLDAFNVFVVAWIDNDVESTLLKWKSWVLVKEHDYSGIPETTPIPTISELPDSVKPWLMPTGCVQWEDPFVYNIAQYVRDTTNDLIVLAEYVADYCNYIHWDKRRFPMSFDAYFTLRWGSSCTGHAHAGAALFRANGVPCRVLLNLYPYINQDMHWIIEYYIPQYGWVKLESAAGLNPNTEGHKELITFACRPEDEFSMIHPDNLESYWFTSDTVFPRRYPFWGRAHSSAGYKEITAYYSKVDSIISITDSVYRNFTTYQGINLTGSQSSYFQMAKESQFKAYNYIKSEDVKIDSLIIYLNRTLDLYRNIGSNSTQTIFFDDFENGENGWSHAGINDEWELGTPINPGPSNTYSGNNCWGTDLDDKYSNNADCYLLSPSIKLGKHSCAYLSVKIWNDLEDSLQGYSPKDRFWIELSTDNGDSFFPITTHLAGVIDYNTGVPKVGGWSRLVLDLTPYIDSTIKIRFHFTSNNSITRPGSYIDDVHVYGRDIISTGIDVRKKDLIRIKCYPNPTSNKITLEVLNPVGQSEISLLNIKGQELWKRQISDCKTQIDLSDLAMGIYFLKVVNENAYIIEKIIKDHP